jgi:hypothetical protein
MTVSDLRRGLEKMAKTDDMEAWVGLPVRLRGEAHQEGIVRDYRTDPPGLLVILDYSEDCGSPIWFSPDELELLK